MLKEMAVKLADEFVTVAAIIGICWLAYIGVAEPMIYVGAIAGLGGYRLRQNGKKT